MNSAFDCPGWLDEGEPGHRPSDCAAWTFPRELTRRAFATRKFRSATPTRRANSSAPSRAAHPLALGRKLAQSSLSNVMTDHEPLVFGRSRMKFTSTWGRIARRQSVARSGPSACSSTHDQRALDVPARAFTRATMAQRGWSTANLRRGRSDPGERSDRGTGRRRPGRDWVVGPMRGRGTKAGRGRTRALGAKTPK